MDDPQRERIRDDLKGIVKGELLFDDLSRLLYSTDASIFQVRPLGVVAPRDEADVQALVRYASEHQVPLIPRGAGTGVAGESLGNGLIVDLSQHFRAIVAIGSDTVRVQPGVVLRALNAELAAIGRRFAPDPASGGTCTLGGMLATNASGARVLRHGYTRDHVASLRLVLDNGEVADAGVLPRESIPTSPGDRFNDIVRHVAQLLRRHEELIQACQPRTRFNRCGYLLDGVLTAEALDLPRLLTGSEGTLGLFTEATLRTVPLPGGQALLLLGFGSLEAALRATQRALPSQPAACELIERRLLSLARGSDAELAPLIPEAVEAVLLIELEADSPGAAAVSARKLLDLLQRHERLALLAGPVVGQEEMNRLWRLREVVLPSLYQKMRGGPQPVAFIEDVAVPPEQVREYLHRVQEILQRHETTASFLVHAGSGQVHARPFLDLRRPEDTSKLWAIGEEVHKLALDLGGTVSSQHGTGLARTPWVARQYGRLYSVFREIKAVFDPRGLFNPGKIIGPDPGMPTWPLRRVASEGMANGTAENQDPQPSSNGDSSPPALHVPPATLLRWPLAEVVVEAHSCNGCGQCRTEAPGQRMCPLFRATRAEAATPRAKANLMRHLLHPETDARLLSSAEVREVADLCVNCKMCARECPAHVNIPKLMLEAKAAHVAEHGLDRSDWVLARTESFAALGSAFSFVANAALSSRTARWLLERLFGVSRQRRLPAFAARSFLSQAQRRGWTRRPHTGRARPRVAFFVDTFANYNDPQIAEATVAVLRHHGIDVYVPPGQYGSGMAPLAHGDLETARETAQRNVRMLAELAREGYEIICSEPTAALALQQDYLDILEDPDARLVAEQTRELTAYLGQLLKHGRLRTDFRRHLNLTVGHHVPCHLKALGSPPAAPGLLALIPGLRVRTIDVSCSGMAGTFGFKAENYAVSLEAGAPMLQQLRLPEVAFGSTECSSCRLQMEEGSGKRALHPVQYLALAYGLLPDVARRLHEPIGELILR